MRNILTALIGLTLGVMGLIATAGAQGANSMYLTAASGSYKVNDSFTVAVRVNTSDQVNAAGVRLSYNENLQFVSIDGGGSAFGVDATSTGGGGTVSVDRGTVTPVSGDQLVTKVTFKAVSAGTGSVQVSASSEALSATTNQNVLTTRNGGSYSIAGAVTGAPTTPVTTTTSTTDTKPATPTTTKSNAARTTITPRGNTTPAPLPGESTVQLSAPATIETMTDDTREVSKVEYLLNGKLVNTDTAPPFSYSVDTENLANGTYSLTTKTYYADGKVDTSTASLMVKNAFGLKQAWLQLKRYAWAVVFLLVLAGGLVYLKFFRGGSRFGPRGRKDQPTADSGHGSIVVGGASQSTIQPTIQGPTSSIPGSPPSTPIV